ncbi:MAG: hypothetical protein ACRDQZ_13245 [Mycobacteriales bacterium]
MRDATLQVIAQANDIIATYARQGYDLTLRQLYYQFVSRDLIANKQTEYKRLGDIVSKGRRAGLIDWSAIVDRTRNLQSLSTWDSPSDIVNAVATQFRYDWWANQPVYCEVWFEKDALMGVFERPANRYRVPFFSCRGYTSDSEIWGASQRLVKQRKAGKRCVILHFGDHDPSGIDMTRDIGDRLRLFRARVDVRRLALNFDQIDQYGPPPNPAKETDSRFAEYQALHGDESWELDALEPTVLGALVRDEVDALVDKTAWDAERLREAEARAELAEISANYDDIVRDYPAAEVGLADLDDEEDE